MTRGRVGQDYEEHKDNEGRWRTRRGDLKKRDEMDVDAEINRDRCRNQDRDRHGEKGKGGRRKGTRRERE